MDQYATRPVSAAPRAEHSAPRALAEVSQAAEQYAAAAERFLTARDDLRDAQIRWSAANDVLATVREKEGI